MISGNSAASAYVLVTPTVCSLPRTIESLYKELVEEGLLVQTLKVNLSDYIGKVHGAERTHAAPRSFLGC